jgi:hypothetical protein
MVVLPVVFLAVYPVLIVLLPENLVVLADLPQDLTVLLLLDAILMPMAGATIFWLARRRAAARGWGVPRDKLDNRVVN